MSIDPALAVVALSPTWFVELDDWVTDLQWHPSSPTLAAASASGRVARIDPEARRSVDLEPHQGGVLVARWSPDGERLATGGDDGRLAVHRDGSCDEWHARGWINALDWSPDGTRLGAGIDRHIVVVTTADMREIGRVRGASTVTGVAWADDERLAGAAYGGLQWVDRAGAPGPPQRLLFGGAPRALQTAPDHRRIAVGCQGGATSIWRLDTASEEIVLPGNESGGKHLAWDATSDRLAVAASGVTTIWDFRVDDDELPLGTGLDVLGMPSAVSWSQDGEHLALGIRLPTGGGVVLWRPADGCLPVLAIDAGCPVSAIAWSPHDRHALAVGTAEGTVCVIDPIALLPTC
jgi:WD40 repeat protein